MYNIYKKEIQGHIKETKTNKRNTKKTKNKIKIKNKENQKTIKQKTT